MDNRILDICLQLKRDYGDDIFENTARVNNMLKDLAADMPKERIQIRNILEMGGYNDLKKAGGAYPLIKNKLIRAYSDTYCVDESIAAWTVGLVSSMLGHDAPPDAPQRVTSRTAPRALYQNIISGGMYHSVALRRDGTVLAIGNNESGQCDVSDWRNITAVAAGGFHTIGVKKDGTVIAAGDNLEGQCDVSGWTNIVAVRASSRHTVGLRADGRVVATGRNRNNECGVGHWRNIVDITLDFGCTYGIKRDGSAVAAGDIPYDRYDVTALTGIKGLAGMSGRKQILALRVDDVAIKPRSKATRWPDLVSIAATKDCFIGLTTSGRVKVLEYYWPSSGMECNLDDWSNIISIAAGTHHVLGLRDDGRVMSAIMDSDPQNDEGQTLTGLWEDVGIYSDG